MGKCFISMCAVLGTGIFCSCSGLSESNKTILMEAFGDMLANGTISQVQYDAFVQLLMAGSTDGLKNMLLSVAEVAATIGGSLLGVRLWRGSTTARKGIAPKTTSP